MKKKPFHTIIQFLFLIITITCSLAYAIGSALPWIADDAFWSFALIGLVFPYLCLAIVVIAIVWIFIKKRYTLYLLFLLLLGTKQISSFVALNKVEPFAENKKQEHIRIASWNIGNMEGKTHEADATKYKVEEIIEFLTQQNADVVCVQEFDDCNKCKSLGLVLKKYKFHYLPLWVVGPQKHKSGNVIFSKYPIIYKDSMSFEDGHNIIQCDIAINSDTLSFYNTHLSSYKFSNEEFKEIEETKTATNLEQKQQKQIAKKLKNTLKAHVKEVDVTKKIMATTSYPKIFCADLNEVPNSNTYWRLKENMKDAFLEKGFGFGKTYNSLWPILRIDYILTDKKFNIHQFTTKPTQLSDHNLIIADVSLKN